MEHVTFRLAQPSDFDDVLKVSENLQSDYLPFYYHDWLDKDNVIALVAYAGEKLVGFGACFIVDEGKTFIGRAGRILETLRGQGISLQYSEALKEYVQRKSPNVCRERFASTFSTNWSKYKIYVTQLLEYEILSYEVKDQARHRSLHFPSPSSVEVEVCTREYFADVILSPPVARKLFPNNVVTVPWVPFEPVPSNIQHMLEENDCILVDKCSKQTFPRSISFGRLSPRVEHVVWQVCVYTDDPVLFEAHLWHQLKRGCQVIEEDFIIRAGFENKTFKARGIKLLEEQLKAQSDPFSNKTMKIFERKLTDKSRL